MTQLMHVEDIKFTFSHIELSRLNCLCYLSGRRRPGVVRHRDIFKRVRPGKRHKQKPITNETGCARHTGSGRSADGWSGPSEPRLAKASLDPKRTGNRRTTPDPIPIPGHRSTTISNGDFFFALDAKAD